MSLVPLHQSQTPKPKNREHDEAEDEDEDEDATIDSTDDDVPSRNRLKMSIEMRVDARRHEKRKESIKQELSPSQEEIDFDDTIQTAPDPKDHACEKLISPAKSLPKQKGSMDGVRTFLTELPPEG